MSSLSFQSAFKAQGNIAVEEELAHLRTVMAELKAGQVPPKIVEKVVEVKSGMKVQEQAEACRLRVEWMGEFGAPARRRALQPAPECGRGDGAARRGAQHAALPSRRAYSIRLTSGFAHETARRGGAPRLDRSACRLSNTDEDLHELIAYLRGLRVHISLIPYNSIREESGLIGSAVKRRRSFAAGLTAAGFTVTVRYSLGTDIAAACGQLVQLGTAPLPSVEQ